MDAASITTFVNSKLTGMLGYSAEEMLGKSSLSVLDEEALAQSRGNTERRRAGITETYDFRIKRKDGSTLWALVSANPLFDADGQYAGSLGMLADITERKNAEEEIKRLKSASGKDIITAMVAVAVLGTVTMRGERVITRAEGAVLLLSYAVFLVAIA